MHSHFVNGQARGCEMHFQSLATRLKYIEVYNCESSTEHRSMNSGV